MDIAITENKLNEIHEYVQSLLYKDEVLAVNQSKLTNSIYILISDSRHSLFKILRISDHYTYSATQLDSINTKYHESDLKSKIQQALYSNENWFKINEFEYSCLYLPIWLRKNDYQLCYHNGDIYIVDLHEFPKVETHIFLNNEIQSKFRFFKRCGLLVSKSSNSEKELALTTMATTIINIKGQDKAYRKYWYAKFKSQFNINNLFDVETDHMFNRHYKSFNQHNP